MIQNTSDKYIFIQTMSEKRSIEQLEAELQAIRKEERVKRQASSAEPRLDRAFQEWEQQLSPFMKNTSGKWKLYLYPSRDPELLRGHQNPDHPGLATYDTFNLTSPWTAKQYFGCATGESNWNENPIVVFADRKVDLLPKQKELLRVFGVMFFVVPFDVEFKPKPSELPNICYGNVDAQMNRVHLIIADPNDVPNPDDIFVDLSGDPRKVKGCYNLIICRERQEFLHSRKDQVLKQLNEISLLMYDIESRIELASSKVFPILSLKN